MRRHLHKVLFIAGIFYILFAVAPAFCQVDSISIPDTSAIASTDSTAEAGVNPPEARIKELNGETLLVLFKHAGIIGKITAFFLIVGLFMAIQKSFQLRSDRRDSLLVVQKIEKTKIDRAVKMTELDKLMAELRGAHNVWAVTEARKWSTLFRSPFRRMQYGINRMTGKKDDVLEQEVAARTSVFLLISKLYEVYKATHDTELFNAEVSSYNQNMKDKYNPFKTMMGYLSESAGAFGLLGTVWGMFLTFFSGTMEQQVIIQGMGIALATTIIGIVVSLIINTASTIIDNQFDRHLEFISKMANDFQVRLLRMAMPSLEILADHQASKIRMPQQIRALSKQQLTGKVNQASTEPIMVVVQDHSDIGVDGVNVTFELDGNNGALNGGGQIAMVQTQGGGIAQTNWKFGPKSGQRIVRVTSDGLNNSTVIFYATITPAAPEIMLLKSDKIHVGSPGQELPEPFIVTIEDKYQNPVADVDVNFSIIEGGGHFRNSHSNQATVATDNQGMAKTNLVLPEKQDIIKVAVKAKGLERTEEINVVAK